MKLDRFSYPALAAVLFGISSWIHAFTETSRVFPEYQNLFFCLKVFYGSLGLLMSLFFRKQGASDFSLGLSMVIFVSYCVVFMWFAPLYEAAYMQVAIGCAFFRIRRKWLFPLIFGLGLMGMLVSYYLQDQWNWVLPPADRLDWVWIAGLIFVFSWLIQKFVIGSFQREEDRLMRFSLIGVETTRLIHDLKGLLSSPLLIIDNLKESNPTFSKDQYRNQMMYLAQDMREIENMIKSIHRLVIVHDEKKPVNLGEVIGWSLTLLQRRLTGIQLRQAEDRILESYPNRLHSVFFNLILNSIEAFHKNQIKEPVIEMCWNEKDFIYRDNAGGFQDQTLSTKGSTGGLGLFMVKNDLERIGARLKVVPEKDGTAFYIRF